MDLGAEVGREQSQQGHQESKIWRNEWHGEASVGGGHSPGPWSLAPVRGRELPRWKLILPITFFPHEGTTFRGAHVDLKKTGE